ncbi:MAG: ABC transporter substrate-binding protein [Paracoccus sp. (in: a-proteobacteria)]|uniref:ABC transporter substrate-binding protein n=1 Tax=Paracoccus sp. TaxID=267 RepID=UPI0026E0F577|nr:ABC transporter substrate-binding protein [Paracoccus sp. (in: a-proteobacteria)]MDO5613793.1 ABC transporter substrate-binding protein [Paracoccus sp. (in: a-proteobacteria)]
MRRAFALIAAALPLGAAAQDRSITVISWGGDFSAAQVEALNRPFTAETGIGVLMVDAGDPALPLKAQAEAGNVTTDVASIGYAEATQLCDAGVVQPIDHAILTPAPDGTPLEQDFMPHALAECFVATDIYSTVIAWDDRAMDGAVPQTVADFFDLERFPGRRGVLKEPRFTLEMALMADGVPAAQVYELLSTDAGVDRAFAKLDTIKAQSIFWEAGAQPRQLLADGEVAMAMAYNGRIFAARVDDDVPVSMMWDGQIYEIEGWVIPTDAPNPAEALEYVAYTTSPQVMARFAGQISYGLPRHSAAALVGNYRDTDMPMAGHLPTAPENMSNALQFDHDFWGDHLNELNERFARWVAS